MTTTQRDRALSGPMETGIVVRLEPSAGFGYVQNGRRDRQYIFVYGSAIKRSETRKLAVGKSVHFRLGEDDRVEELIPE